MLCEEMTPRQGCFVGWHTIVELALSFHNLIVGPNGLRQSLHLEKTPLRRADPSQLRLRPNDVMIVISTSGIREVIRRDGRGSEAARPGRRRRRQPGSLRPGAAAHESGKKLTDVADIILDNGAPVGDSLLTLAHGPDDGGRSGTLGGGAGHEHAALRGRRSG